MSAILVYLDARKWTTVGRSHRYYGRMFPVAHKGWLAPARQLLMSRAALHIAHTSLAIERRRFSKIVILLFERLLLLVSLISCIVASSARIVVDRQTRTHVTQTQHTLTHTHTHTLRPSESAYYAVCIDYTLYLVH